MTDQIYWSYAACRIGVQGCQQSKHNLGANAGLLDHSYIMELNECSRNMCKRLSADSKCCYNNNAHDNKCYDVQRRMTCLSPMVSPCNCNHLWVGDQRLSSGISYIFQGHLYAFLILFISVSVLSILANLLTVFSSEAFSGPYHRF